MAVAGDSSSQLSIPQCVLLPLLTVSKSSSLNEALRILLKASRSANGRADLASKNMTSTVLSLIHYLSHPSSYDLLLLALMFLQNLCAGERTNQDLFIELKGVEILSALLASVSESDYEIIRAALQTLANVILAGGRHQQAVWYQFFPEKFIRIAGVKRQCTCDPLCMILFTSLDGNGELVSELCGFEGLSIVSEIVRTASKAGCGEDWFKLLLSRICLEESWFSLLFSILHPVFPKKSIVFKGIDMQYVSEQAFLLSILAEALNERISEITVPIDFASSVFQIFKTAIGAVDFSSRSISGLPTGSAAVDVLGYSVNILRLICAQSDAGSRSIVNMLISNGLLEMVLHVLHDLELPLIIKKSEKQVNDLEGTMPTSFKVCLYKGFCRDIVGVIGNCAYQRRHAQDEIRQKNGILSLLQRCVMDEYNPFMREWSIWAIRNLLQGNIENQRFVAELEFQGSIDVPEIAGLGLRIEVDPNTQQTKLVNIP